MDPKPLWLLAELTYKCPLQCPYCSNPLDFAGPRFKRELSTDEWCRVFREAKALGVLQLGLSGGEPTLRADLEDLVRQAHGLGLYTSLITSAYRLTKERLAALKAAGLDHVQISIQGADAELSDAVAGTASYGDKIAAYHYTRELGFPLTVNVVLHRRNLHQVEALIRLAESLGAERIELANTDRKSTRLNSSHGYISYAVFCLKKKNNQKQSEPLIASTLVIACSPASS